MEPGRDGGKGGKAWGGKVARGSPFEIRVGGGMPGRAADVGGIGLASKGAVGVERRGEGGGAGSSSLISPSSLKTFSEVLTTLLTFFWVLASPASISTSPSSWMVVAVGGGGGTERAAFFDEEASPSAAPTRAADFLFLVLRARDRRVEGSVDLAEEEDALVDGLGEEGGGEGGPTVEEEEDEVEVRWL